MLRKVSSAVRGVRSVPMEILMAQSAVLLETALFVYSWYDVICMLWVSSPWFGNLLWAVFRLVHCYACLTSRCQSWLRSLLKKTSQGTIVQSRHLAWLRFICPLISLVLIHNVLKVHQSCETSNKVTTALLNGTEYIVASPPCSETESLYTRRFWRQYLSEKILLHRCLIEFF
jgi:hypothetical protein